LRDLLPFCNFSTDAQNAYFADGIQDDVLTNLAKISDLKVISRTSVMPYRGQAHNVREIGKALDVACDGPEAEWLSLDEDCLDAAFVPGIGWPGPGGFLPREVLTTSLRDHQSAFTVEKGEALLPVFFTV